MGSNSYIYSCIVFSQFFKQVRFLFYYNLVLIGFRLHNRIGFFFGSVIWILAFASILIDGFHASVVDDLEGCYSPYTGQTWGSHDGGLKAMNCSIAREEDFTYANGATSKCVCISYHHRCYGYDLANGSNCGTIFSVYYSELAASCAFSTVLCFLVSVYIVFSGNKVRMREDEAINSVPIPTIELRETNRGSSTEPTTTPYMIVQAVTTDDIELHREESGYSLVRVGIRVEARPLE